MTMNQTTAPAFSPRVRRLLAAGFVLCVVLLAALGTAALAVLGAAAAHAGFGWTYGVMLAGTVFGLSFVDLAARFMFGTGPWWARPVAYVFAVVLVLVAAHADGGPHPLVKQVIMGVAWLGIYETCHGVLRERARSAVTR